MALHFVRNLEKTSLDFLDYLKAYVISFLFCNAYQAKVQKSIYKGKQL